MVLLKELKGRVRESGFLQSVSGSLSFSEEPDFFIVHLTFHGYDPSSFFQKRETQDEKGSKIGKSP